MMMVKMDHLVDSSLLKAARHKGNVCQQIAKAVKQTTTKFHLCIYVYIHTHMLKIAYNTMKAKYKTNVLRNIS